MASLKPLPIVAIAILALIPFAPVDDFLKSMVFLFMIYLASAYGWNIIGGFAGQINLGHAAFFGMGAYVMGQSLLAGLHPYVAVAVGGLAGLGTALIMSPLLRLRGDYFAIGTLGFTEALKIALVNIHAYGYTFPPDPTLTFTANYYYALAIFVAVAFLNYIILKSRLRFAFISIRENETLAAASGIGIFKYKVLALCLSGVMVGLIGGIYSYNLLYVQPEHVFGIEWTLIPLFIVLIGGRGTIIGPIFGLMVYLGTYYALGFLIPEISLLLFGLIVVLVMKFMPQGLIEQVFYGRLNMRRRLII